MKHNLYAYVGTYTNYDSKGIYCFKLDSENNIASNLTLAADIENPSYVISDNNNNYLFAVIELQQYDGTCGGAVASFSINKNNGGLKLINIKPTYGKDPCHLTLSSDNKYLFVSNYSSGSLTVFRVNTDGSISDKINIVQHSGSSVNEDRQESAHIHSSAFLPDEKHLCIVDLGIDKLSIYDFDNETGALEYNESLSINLSPGCGPRHLVFHPKYNFLYIINELSSEVTALKYDAASFKLKKLQTLSTLPNECKCQNICAAIKISSDGRFLYASNRGHNSIAIYRIEKNIGTLELISVTPVGGDFPRDFSITPDGRTLYAANQKSDNITVFNIDPDTGMLKIKETNIKVSSPVCINFFELSL